MSAPLREVCEPNLTASHSSNHAVEGGEHVCVGYPAGHRQTSVSEPLRRYNSSSLRTRSPNTKLFPSQMAITETL